MEILSPDWTSRVKYCLDARLRALPNHKKKATNKEGNKMRGSTTYALNLGLDYRSIRYVGLPIL